MADKIPVGRTVARAYAFTFGNVVNNLGAVWIPAALMFGLLYYYYEPYAAAVANLVSDDAQAKRSGLAFVLMAGLIAAFLGTAQMAALVREALGLRTGSAFLQFPFRPAAWRLFAAYFLYGLVLLVIYFGAIFGGVLLNGLLRALLAHSDRNTAAGIAALAVLIYIVVVCVAFVYIGVRMLFLLAAVAVAERKVSLTRAWQLARRNFWRIFLITVVLLIPIVVVQAAYLYATYGWDFIPPLHATQEQIKAFQHHQQETSRLLLERMHAYWYIYDPMNLAISLLTYGLFAGASAAAYRALVPAQDARSELHAAPHDEIVSGGV